MRDENIPHVTVGLDLKLHFVEELYLIISMNAKNSKVDFTWTIGFVNLAKK